MTSPFGFYRTARRCPECRQPLVTATPLTRRFTQGLLQDLGLTCYCVACNSRYRATTRLRFYWVAWAGALGGWIWWKTTSLEKTLSAEIE